MANTNNINLQIFMYKYMYTTEFKSSKMIMTMYDLPPTIYKY